MWVLLKSVVAPDLCRSDSVRDVHERLAKIIAASKSAELSSCYSPALEGTDNWWAQVFVVQLSPLIKKLSRHGRCARNLAE